MYKVLPLPAFHDNYIWTIIHPDLQACAVVDPGDAKPVLNELKRTNLKLTAILITHHHWDHTGGIDELLDQFHVPVFGPKQDGIAQVSEPLSEGDTIELPELKCSFQILDIPGHTLGHIAYYDDSSVFTGDTLFTGGCGRLFEGTPQQMYHSLQKIASLPQETQVYCGHEYTQANLRFAKAVEPNNKALQERIQATQTYRKAHRPTVPAPLALERQTNPFLRCQESIVIQAASQHAKHTLTDPIDVFASIRAWKDKQ